MFIKEHRKENANGSLLKKYRAEHAKVVAISINSKGCLLRDKLINQINKFSVYAIKLRELSLNENS